MSTLPQYLNEAPVYRWNPDTQMFDAEVMSGGEVVMRYAIPKTVMFEIQYRIRLAIEDSEGPPLIAVVLPMRREAEG